MTFDLFSALPILLPKAIGWAEAQSSMIMRTGAPLSHSEISIALNVGVSKPELIHVLEVASLPLPEDSDLRQAAQNTGLLGPGMVGLTLGHGIFICRGYRSNRLLSHEFRHVYQYEQAGSISNFLPIYLQQIATVGYQDSPYEQDARSHECA